MAFGEEERIERGSLESMNGGLVMAAAAAAAD